MFIKKDLRKIPEIFADASKKKDGGKENDDAQPPLTDLRLQRRKAEFQGSVRTLCQPSHVPSLIHVKSLSLYDCNISDLAGIGMLPNLECLSLGRNPVESIPEEFGDLENLQELWLDDCQLQGAFPEPLLQCQKLQELRLSNNQIDALPSNFGTRLAALRVLGLDHNHLTSLPESMANLTHLTTLLVRHNRLTALPQHFPGSSMSSLKLLHVSSNQLTALPDCIVDCSSLTHVYANGNALTSIPMGIELLYNLQHLNLAHNQIGSDDTTAESRLQDIYDLFGKPNADGNCIEKEGVKVMLRGNPALTKKKKSPQKKVAGDDDDDDHDHDDLSMDDKMEIS